MCWSSSLTPQVCTTSMGEWVGGARFFPLGDFPRWQKFCPSPNRPLSPLFDQSLSPPQLSFVPQNFKNFTSLFSEFWLPFSSKLHRRALFYAWNTKICSNFAVGVHYWPQQTIFPNPPSSDSVPNVRPPPIWLHPWWGPKITPESNPPPKILWKNPGGGTGDKGQGGDWDKEGKSTVCICWCTVQFKFYEKIIIKRRGVGVPPPRCSATGTVGGMQEGGKLKWMEWKIDEKMDVGRKEGRKNCMRSCAQVPWDQLRLATWEGKHASTRQWVSDDKLAIQNVQTHLGGLGNARNADDQ